MSTTTLSSPKSPSSPSLSTHPDAIIILLTLPFYVCTYYRDTFIDEPFAVVRNKDVFDTTRNTIYDILINDFWGQYLWPNDGIHWTHKSYRPLVTYSFRISYLLFPDAGEDWYHLASLRFVNCLIHTLVCLAMRRVRFFKHNVFAVYLFAVHPVHVENLVYLVGRADTLATLFWMMGLWWPFNSVVYVGICAVLAGLCKETGFTLPVHVAFLLFLDRNSESSQSVTSGSGSKKSKNSISNVAKSISNRNTIKAFLMLVAFLLIFGIRSWYVGGTTAEFGYIDTPVKYMEGKMVRFWSYLNFHQIYGQLLVVPWNLSWDYSFDSLPCLYQEWRDFRSMGIVGSYIVVLMAFLVPGSRRKKEREEVRQKMIEKLKLQEETKTSQGTQQSLSLSESQEHLLLKNQNQDILTDYFAASMVVIPFVPASNLFFLVGTTIGERLLYPVTVGSCLALERWFCDSRLNDVRVITDTDIEPKVQDTKKKQDDGDDDQNAESDKAIVLESQPIKDIPPFLSGYSLIYDDRYQHQKNINIQFPYRLLKLLYLSFYMYVAYIRLSHWRTKEVLYERDGSEQYATRWQRRSAKTLHQYGILVQAAGRLEEALQIYNATLNVFDDNAMTDYTMARVYLEKDGIGGCENALKIFLKINEGHGIGFHDGNQFLLNNDFGYSLVCLGHYQEAIPILQESIDKWLNPNMDYVYNSLALAYWGQAGGVPGPDSQSGSQQGLTIQQKVLQNLNNDQEKMNSLIQKIMNIFNEGIAYHPNCFYLWFNAGIFLLQNGAIENGQEALQKSEGLTKTIWEYQILQDAVGKMKEGRIGEVGLAFMQVVTHKK